MNKLVLSTDPYWESSGHHLSGVQALKDADLILAEDTRTSGKLLKHFEISTRAPHFTHTTSTRR